MQRILRSPVDGGLNFVLKYSTSDRNNTDLEPIFTWNEYATPIEYSLCCDLDHCSMMILRVSKSEQDGSLLGYILNPSKYFYFPIFYGLDYCIGGLTSVTKHFFRLYIVNEHEFAWIRSIQEASVHGWCNHEKPPSIKPRTARVELWLEEYHCFQKVSLRTETIWKLVESDDRGSKLKPHGRQGTTATLTTTPTITTIVENRCLQMTWRPVFSQYR